MTGRRTRRCPRCGSLRVAPVAFGGPEELTDLWVKGVVFPLPREERKPGWPHMGCFECGETWGPSRLHLHTDQAC